MKVRDFTKKLKWDEKLEIIKNFKELEKKGVLGNCLLREFSRKVEFAFTQKNENVIWWMNLVVNDIYRMIAEKAIKKGFSI